MTAPSAAEIGPYTLGRYGRGSREIRCPRCATPLGIQDYGEGYYTWTRPSRYLVKLADGSYGKSRKGRMRPLDDGGIGRVTRAESDIQAPHVVRWEEGGSFDVHCPNPECGGRRIRIAWPADER